MLNYVRIMLLGLFATCTFGGIAFGQTESMKKFEMMMKDAADGLGSACGPEVQKFCSTVNPGDGRIILCMMAHEDQLTIGCGKAILDSAILLGQVQSFFQYAVNACEPDIVKACSDVVPGDGNVAECLITNKAELSPLCQEVVNAFEGRFQ